MTNAPPRVAEGKPRWLLLFPVNSRRAEGRATNEFRLAHYFVGLIRAQRRRHRCRVVRSIPPMREPPPARHGRTYPWEDAVRARWWRSDKAGANSCEIGELMYACAGVCRRCVAFAGRSGRRSKLFARSAARTDRRHRPEAAYPSPGNSDGHVIAERSGITRSRISGDAMSPRAARRDADASVPRADAACTGGRPRRIEPRRHRQLHPAAAGRRCARFRYRPCQCIARCVVRAADGPGVRCGRCVRCERPCRCRIACTLAR